MDTVTTAFEQLLTQIIVAFPNVIAALVITVLAVVVAAFTARLVQRTLASRGVDREISLLLIKLTRYSIIIIGITIALQQVNFNLTAFLAGLGIVGFTFGFAIQDVSKNFVAGILLLLQQPFDLGDAIEVAGFSGTVQTIDLRATEVLTFDGRYVLIPNADVFTKAIVNFSRSTSRRVELTIGVDYASDLDRVQELTLATVSGIEGVMSEPAPQVVFNNFNASSIDFTLYFWVELAKMGVLDGTASAIKEIKSAYEANGVNIPYPIQVIKSQDAPV